MGRFSRFVRLFCQWNSAWLARKLSLCFVVKILAFLLEIDAFAFSRTFICPCLGIAFERNSWVLVFFKNLVFFKSSEMFLLKLKNFFQWNLLNLIMNSLIFSARVRRAPAPLSEADFWKVPMWKVPEPIFGPRTLLGNNSLNCNSPKKFAWFGHLLVDFGIFCFSVSSPKGPKMPQKENAPKSRKCLQYFLPNN